MKQIIVFMGVVWSVFLMNLFTPAKEMSELERRELAQFPEVSMESIKSGEFSEQFSEYVSDQFFNRDFFRGIKTSIQVNLLNRTENNGVYIKDDELYEKFDSVDYDVINTHIKNINRFISELDNDVYLSLIPSKSFGVDLPNINQKELAEYISENIDAIYLDQFDYYLTHNAFLQTDPHWTQSSALDIYNMYLKAHLINESDTYEYDIEKLMEEYQGTLFSNIGTGSMYDQLEFYNNSTIEQLKVCVYGLETVCQQGPYFDERMTPYDIYLGGNHPIVTLENESGNGKELVVFRDSFSNAIAPFFAEDYSKVTLIDLRLVRIEYIEQVVDFADADILYLYNIKTMNDDFRLTN